MVSARRRRTVRRARLAREDVARLFARAANGEQAAWNALVHEFGAMVWATTRAHRLNDADAADVFQTTWLRLVENVDSIRDPTLLGAWLATTARRECLAVIRRASRLVPRVEDLADLPSDAPLADDRLIAEQNADAVRAALARLQPRQRALLRMLAADPPSTYDEIGAALGMRIGSIGPTRARALQRLRTETALAELTSDAR